MSCHCPCDCLDRNFQHKSAKLRSKLGYLNAGYCHCKNNDKSNDNVKNYNGSFHKGLQHDQNGALQNPSQYKNLVDALLEGDQEKLAAVQLAIGCEMKLVNPLASLSTALVGAPQPNLQIDTPGSLSSDATAAEIVEVYSQAVARDVEFRNYKSDPTITKLLSNKYMNKANVLANLDYTPPTPFTAQTLFRGISSGELVGPYISQLLYLNVPMGAGEFIQRYTVPLPRYNKRVEWGVTKAETVNMENGLVSSQPGKLALDPTLRYIYNGRSLAELVHSDPAFQVYYTASLILLGLGVPKNSGFPSYPNQAAFITAGGNPGLQCALAEVSGLALKHAWYWKWQVFRRLRPEVYALWVHNVKTGTVENAGNYDLSEVMLDNAVLDDIKNINNGWVPGESYTLPMCYIEGSPTHPAYPAGHAVIAGACCTILKIFFDTSVKWSSLRTPVQPAPGGASLENYTGSDVAEMSVWGEINKLASNIAIGRDWAGVHYRSDGVQGMQLGEQVAVRYMEDTLSSMVENNLDGTLPKITFRKFNGELQTLKATICKKFNL